SHRPVGNTGGALRSTSRSRGSRNICRRRAFSPCARSRRVSRAGGLAVNDRARRQDCLCGTRGRRDIGGRVRRRDLLLGAFAVPLAASVAARVMSIPSWAAPAWADDEDEGTAFDASTVRQMARELAGKPLE